MDRRIKRLKNHQAKRIHYGVSKQEIYESSDLSTLVNFANIEVDEISDQEFLLQDENSTVLLVGDVIWSKLSGKNWWPSMIAYEPNTAIYFHTSFKHVLPVKYHVQFFGKKALRGWVFRSNMMLFQGKDFFLKRYNHPLLPSNQREIWEEAVEEAEHAISLERKERKLAHVFNYGSQSVSKTKRNPKYTEHKKKVKEDLLPFIERRRSTRLCAGKTDKNNFSMDDILNDHSSITQGEEDIEGHSHLFSCGSEFESFPVLNEVNSNIEMKVNVSPECGNSSDSGIDDIEAFEMPSEDVAVLSKRNRKRKVFEGFHTGNEINLAFKGYSKVDLTVSKRNINSTKNVDESSPLYTNIKEKKYENDSKNVQITIPRSQSIIPNFGQPNNSTMTQKLLKKRDSKQKSFVKGVQKETEKENIYGSDSSPLKIDFHTFKDGITEKISKKKINPKVCMLQPIKLESDTKRTFKRKSPAFKDKDEIVTKKRKQDFKSSSKRDDNDNIAIQNDVKIAYISKTAQDSYQFCNICEDVTGELVSCHGSCLHQFHPNCLGLSFTPTNFICDECTHGVHTCFFCSKVGEVIKCSQQRCGKYYHQVCVQSNPCVKFENKLKTKFSCPLHMCTFCVNKKSTKTSGKKIVKCLKCPVASHTFPCLPAGSVIVSPTQMICDMHYDPPKNKTCIHVNTTWCFSCSKGGTLVCCDTCPASFHPECTVGLTTVPNGGWQCEDCRSNKKLKYGDIVWVKYSHYRWWPAVICYLQQVPQKVMNLSHSVGEFPVQFFGTLDYCWVNSGRAFRYAEGDSGGKKGKAYLQKYFCKALEEAKIAFAAKKKELEERELVYGAKLAAKQARKPPHYGHIKTNRPVSCIQTVLERSEWPICQCKTDDPCKNECLNKMLYYECNPQMCTNKDKCQNQRMQRGLHAKTKIFRSVQKGWGLKADEEIKMGDFVIEYVGELIDEVTCRQRIQQYHEKDIYDYYFLTIDRDNIIDAFPRGNLARFMNHSCNPNCETQKWIVSGEVRVGLFATCNIAAGEELCFNYHLDCLGNEKKECKCGSANCSGYLGVPPKSQSSSSSVEKQKVKKKKKKRFVHEDECFSCGDGGELLLCDRLNCTKAYHQDCLIMEQPPRGRWDCPWHFCDECGKISRSMCCLCPNSFCESHLEGQMVELKEDVIVCPAHNKQELEALRREKVDAKKKLGESFNIDIKDVNGLTVHSERQTQVIAAQGNVSVTAKFADGSCGKIEMEPSKKLSRKCVKSSSAKTNKKGIHQRTPLSYLKVKILKKSIRKSVIQKNHKLSENENATIKENCHITKKCINDDITSKMTKPVNSFKQAHYEGGISKRSLIDKVSKKGDHFT